LFLLDTGAGTTIVLNAFGTVTDGAGVNTWKGGFSATIAGETPDQIQKFFCPSGTCSAADFASGRSVSSSQSGDFVADSTVPPVPEPGSLFLLGTGMASLAGLIRRKLAK
jgi:hypothetical protein